MCERSVTGHAPRDVKERVAGGGAISNMPDAIPLFSGEVLDRWVPWVRRWHDEGGWNRHPYLVARGRREQIRQIRQGVESLATALSTGTPDRSLQALLDCIATQGSFFQEIRRTLVTQTGALVPTEKSRDDQRALGQFLEMCLRHQQFSAVLTAIRALDSLNVEGLGRPGVANLIYFLSPSRIVPINRAIVAGYRRLSGMEIDLADWDDYLMLRRGVLNLNACAREWLSTDLGVVAACLFDLGSVAQWHPVPLTKELPAIAQTDVSRPARRVRPGIIEGATQAMLRELGKGWGFCVWGSAAKRSRQIGASRASEQNASLQPSIVGLEDETALDLIDTVWLEPGTHRLVAAFVLEHRADIYSGLVRMLELALRLPDELVPECFIVAPDDRQEAIRCEFASLVFDRATAVDVRFLPYSELRKLRPADLLPLEGLALVKASAYSLRRATAGGLK